MLLRTILLGLLGVALTGAVRAGPVDDYVAWALQGDLSEAEESLAASDDPALRELLAEFRARFIERADGLPLGEIADPLTRAVAALFQDYWREALLAPESLHAAEEELNAGIRALLDEAGHSGEALSDDNLQATLQREIEGRGYHVLLGRTRPLLELMLWEQNEPATFEVQLTDAVQTVNVFFMTGFVSRGWAHFATFGRASSGGWAKPEGLYAIKESYDLESEKFLISYLKHEGRHFADYQLYANLKQADLEYRGKLTELTFAEDSRDHLIQVFHRNAARTETAPHSLANWYVIAGLSRELLDGEWPESPAALTDFPNEVTHAAARSLLEEHTAALDAAGPGIEGVIAP